MGYAPKRQQAQTYNVIKDVDQALWEPRKKQRPAVAQPGSAFSMTTLLRWIGSASLIVGALVYMVQGIHLDSPMDRHGIFLALTTLLGGAGIFAAKKWNEVKGARTFLGLAAASVPVHFSALGAMLYVMTTNASSAMPSMLTFTATDPISVAIAFAVTLLVCVPITKLAFSIFVRQKASLFTTGFLLSNALILFPFRNQGSMLIMLTAAVAIMIYMTIKHQYRDKRMQTAEGRIAKSIFLLPTLVIAGRAIFYDIDQLFLGALFAMFGTYSFFVAPLNTAKPDFRTFLRIIGITFMGAGYLLSISDLIPHHFSDAVRLLCFFVPAGMGLHLLGAFSEANGRILRGFGSFTLMLGILGALLAGSGMPVILLGTAAAVFAIYQGANHEEKASFVIGTLTMGVIGLQQIILAIGNITFNPWITLVGAGITILLMATFFERKSSSLRKTFYRYRQTYQSWT